MKSLPLLLALVFLVSILPAADTLDIYVIDVEGGKAMLVVTPANQAMLVDTGWPGPNDERFRVIGLSDRDPDRIVEAIRAARVKQLDHLVITHYHADHVGGAPRTIAKIPVPIREFVDHGEVVSGGEDLERYTAYVKAMGNTKRVVPKPGDTIPMKGLDVKVITSAAQVLKVPLPGAGAANPFCTSPPGRPDRSENAASVGLLYTFGKFRMIDLGDVTIGKEQELMCPNNPVGSVDLLMVSHHGNQVSNSQTLIHALQPRVAIMNNSEIKIGAASVMKILKSSPGLETLFQLHWSSNAAEDNTPNEFIANLKDSPDGKWIKVSARRDGSFTVTNTRTGVVKSFKKKG